jgi:predicted enzyme related to lactoylglutathione lyase
VSRAPGTPSTKENKNGGQTLAIAADGTVGRSALLADPQSATFAVLEQTV